MISGPTYHYIVNQLKSCSIERHAVEVSLTANPRTKILTASALRIVDVTPNSSSTYTIPGAQIEDAKGLVWLVAFANQIHTSHRTVPQESDEADQAQIKPLFPLWKIPANYEK